MPTRDNMYFAAKESDETATILLQKADSWFQQLNTNGYIDKLRQMWAAYHGAYYSDWDDGHSITFSGEQGELVNLPVNHIRNLGQHILTIITATRPALQARASNTDYKTLVQTKLANGLLDYYLREKRLEDYLKVAVEYAVVFGSGYIKMEWNSTSGEVYDYNEETDTDIKEGDVEFSNLSPFDVVFDTTREDNNHNWVLCRSFANKFDIAAKYPELADKIVDLPTKSELQTYHLETFHFDQTDDIPIYEFYHKRTDSMPEGRYLLFLSEDITLIDSPLPYRTLPVYRIAPSNILGTPYGYTPLFDILPIQDALNSLYSTILTNQNAFGVQNILVPKGADVSISELSGGLNIIEANTQFGDIKPMNLTETPQEIFAFLQMLEQTAETLSGVNSVARGNPESSLKSGTALALVQSMSLQFMSGLQQSYVKLIEEVGVGLINMLRDFASVPRIASISGKSNKTYMKEFVGDDLSQINRVVVDIGNPLAKTIAGRVQMAEQMLQMGLIKAPEQFFTVMNTGRLDEMTDDTQDELFSIKAENEKLVSGEPIIVVMTDQHALHIKSHKAVLSDPDLRLDPALLQRTLDHIQEHIDALRTTDPDLLAIIQEQPLSPPGGSPANQPMPGVPQGAVEGQTAEVMGQPGPPAPAQASMPQPPQPPAPFENLPTNPEDMLPQV